MEVSRVADRRRPDRDQVMDFDRCRDEDVSAYLKGERMIAPEAWPPPKPAEPQNQIRRTDWLGVEYPVSTFDPNLPESNDNPHRTASAFVWPIRPEPWARRRRLARRALIALWLSMLFLAGVAVGLNL